MAAQSLNHIRIVLVEPAGALNVGSIARIMKNMGLERLYLVNPRCDHLGGEAQRMAVHAKDLLQKAIVAPSLTAALTDCQKVIATTARPRHIETTMEEPRDCLPWLLADQRQGAVIFGREDHGLSNEELDCAQRFLTIPINPDYPSLNLAQAVTVCAYELRQIARGKTISAAAPMAPALPEENLASFQNLEGYFQHLEEMLLKVGYLQPHTAAKKMSKFRRLYHRAQLREEDVALLRGILRQVEWTIAEDKS